MRTRRTALMVGVATAVITAGLAMTAAQAGPAPVDGSGPPSFIEHFDAPLDPSFWYVSDGYRNGTYMNCAFNQNNVTVANGMLSIELDDTPYAGQNYSCASIQTTQNYGYGTYETRMRVDRASGTNQSLFTYTGPSHGDPWHEIDFEVLGKDTTEVEPNAWVNGVAAGGGPVALGVDNDVEFVDYAFIWEPDRLRFFTDGRLVRTYTDPAQVPSYTQRIIAMTWGTETLNDWMGPFEYPGQPVVTEYDYIAYTKLGDPCPFPGSMACGVEAPTSSFVDEFDSLDTSRWFVSDGWASGAAYNCTWDAGQVSTTGGALELTFVEQPTGDRAYACAEVQHRKPLGYGTYEVRAQAVENSGVVSSLATYVPASDAGPAEGINLARLLGVDTTRVRYATSRYNQAMTTGSATLDVPSDAAYHDYGMVWSPDRLDFYVDGALTWSVTDPAKIPVRDAKLFLNIWGSETTSSMGAFVPPTGPLTMRVDRVAYTAPGDECQFTGSIACSP
ncbi:glycosyl hydrolase family protein [Jiangella aurantiaca]|uniref:licheninase n=1 Tax=Jiangella aurantiaca TaxID=2530373 RepID=A0A4R5A674_9ACTN|nr:glycosyl hydrolase family protein [Jiangella aurantiaca]